MKDTWNQLEAVQYQRFRKKRFQRLAKARLYQQHTAESKLKHSGHTLPSNSCSARRQRCDRANVGTPRQPSWLLVVVDVDISTTHRGSKLKRSGHTLPSNSCSARRQRCDRANVGTPRQPSWSLVVVDVDGERRRRGGKEGLYTPPPSLSVTQ
jgi:hypothetical protein